ncbi:MAG: hypothetical protein ACRENH_07535 [Gemmatimonadaceae bacterium]
MRASFALIPSRLTLVVALSASCVSARHMVTTANDGDSERVSSAPCEVCATLPVDSTVTRAIEKRVADLKARGGHCSDYGTVLENSYRSGRIMIRPYMWRVGSHLASGEAKPNGEMVLAREIDSLNVGVRTLDDLLRSMEHEAAHIAFRIDTRGVTEDRANDYVRACK